MTVTNLAVKKVAIIGAGPGGLVTLNELLHTSSDGSSTINGFNGDNPLPEKGAFDEIVVFEQNNTIGGLWAYNEDAGAEFPRGVDDISNPSAVRTKLSFPPDSVLDNTNVNSPYKQKRVLDQQYTWSQNGLYKDLYTNVPKDYMRFSSGQPPDEDLDSRYHPFLHHTDVEKYLNEFSKRNQLQKYIRFNSTVERVVKDKSTDKWILYIVNRDSNTTEESWYKEEFDAVVVAVGRFNVPFFPSIENINNFDESNPGIIQHVKSFRSADSLKGKKVLVVGGSISAVDITQYLIPVAKEVHLSLNTSKLDGDVKTKKTIAELWIDSILNDKSLPIIKHPRIKRFGEKDVEFESGRIESFDKIILATGYHIHYPFLDHSENENLDLVDISLTSGQAESALRRINNLYLYIFGLNDPTIAHIGLALSPFFFLMAEANAVAISGIWSNSKCLPSIKAQKEWTDQEFKKEIQGFNDEAGNNFIKKQYEFGPDNRADLLELMVKKDPRAKDILREFYYMNINK